MCSACVCVCVQCGGGLCFCDLIKPLCADCALEVCVCVHFSLSLCVCVCVRKRSERIEVEVMAEMIG